ncbi:hypothetical protein U9M48_015836 [Paspalum notatum var. saurae]|uniref:Uncharacterized protein n=1 Tax=Paspalum notatum var. saurae TaxID=547442 RepID=A0AAQ3T4Z6_PASNO
MAIAETVARKLLHGDAGVTLARGAADVGDISFGLWDLLTGFFANILAQLAAALAGAAHLLVLPLEALWQWLATTVADAAGTISSGLDGIWQHVAGFFAGIFPALAHTLVRRLEELWQWIQAAAAVVLPFVLGVVAVLLLVALIWFCGTTICVATVGVCRALVYAVCYLGHGLYHAVVAVATALSCLLPPCGQCLGCCAVVTMRAPGAAGMLISRAAFEAAPALYFVILRAAGPVVAAAVFCTGAVANIVAVPIAALFGVSVGAMSLQ